MSRSRPGSRDRGRDSAASPGKHVMDEPPALHLRKELAVPFVAGSREEVLQGWEGAVKDAGVNLWAGPNFEVTAVQGQKGKFTLALKDGKHVTAENVVITIGLQGNLRTFGVSGDELPHVGYQLDDPDQHVDKDVVVVGAGDAAIENAVALAKRDWRDLLMAAGFGEDIHAHMSWLPKQT